MSLSSQDKQLVQNAVNSGGCVDVAGMNSKRAEEIRAEEARIRAQQANK